MAECKKEILESKNGLTNTVSEIYDDGLKPAVQETGKVLALIPQAINAALAPLRNWIAAKEYNVAETEKLLAQKLENVDPDKIVTPEPYVAVPAIQAISYSMNSAELRNLYANLLAKAMNQETKDSVHPSFNEIIKQMTPADADIFKILYQSTNTPIMNLYIEREIGRSSNYIYNVTFIDKYDYETVSISINNLIRLGLIEIVFERHYTDDGNYDQIRSTECYKEIKEELENLNFGKVMEERGYINNTSLGDLFYKICVID